MKVAIVGQQDFGKAVLEAFLARGDKVAGVFCAPEKPGARPDALKTAAQEKGVPVFQFASLKSEEARQSMKGLDVELGIMAFVLQFAPQDFVNIPKRGTIQYHPSLLPRYRGPSSINWPIIRGDTKTGLTILGTVASSSAILPVAPSAAKSASAPSSLFWAKKRRALAMAFWKASLRPSFSPGWMVAPAMPSFWTTKELSWFRWPERSLNMWPKETQSFSTRVMKPSMVR